MKVFSIEQCLKSDEVEQEESWMKRCEGKPLDSVKENGDGMIGNYFIAFEWLVDK